MCLLKSLPRPLIGCFFIPAWPEQRSYPEVGGRGDASSKPSTAPDGAFRFQYFSLTGGAGEKEGGGKEAGGGVEITQVIPNPAAGANGGIGGTISTSRDGASTEEIRPTMGGKPLERILEGGSIEEAQKYWPGTVVLLEIWQYQKSTELLIYKHPFMRVVCKITQDLGWHDLCFQVYAVMALQEAAEFYLTSLLGDANLCAIHVKCITIMPKEFSSHIVSVESILTFECILSQSLFLFLLIVGCVG